MTLRGIIAEAFSALSFNRQRSLLTMASLAWGVSCFVILSSYGEGFGRALHVSFQAVGQDLVLMFGGQTSSQAGGERAGHRIRLELEDVQTIRETIPLVGAVSAEFLLRGLPVVRGKKTISLERQVRIAAGSLVVLSSVLGVFLHPGFMGISAFVGAGLGHYEALGRARRTAGGQVGVAQATGICAIVHNISQAWG